MIDQNQCYLIETFGRQLDTNTNTKTFEDAMKFFQTIVYNGSSSDNIAATRIKKYEFPKNKYLPQP